MSPGDLLRQEIEKTPEPADQSFNGLALSETVLARDWNHPEEDAAWADL